MEITVRLVKAKANFELAKNVTTRAKCSNIVSSGLNVLRLLCLFFLQDGSTPLCEASLSGSMDIVDVLLSAGATVDQEDEVNTLRRVTT